MSNNSDGSPSSPWPIADQTAHPTLPFWCHAIIHHELQRFNPHFMNKNESRHARTLSNPSSQSSSSDNRRPRKNPEEFSIEERLALLETSPRHRPVTLLTWVPDSLDVQMAVWNVPRLMLKAFSPALNAEIKSMDSDALVLPVASKDSVICLVNWMMEFCQAPDKVPPIALGDCSVQEWLTLWDTAKDLAIHPATRQLSKQCEDDCRDLCRTQLLEAWLGCRNSSFNEAIRVVPVELERRLSERFPGPDLMEHLWNYAKCHSFTKTAITSFAKHTLSEFRDGTVVEGFSDLPQSLKGAIYAAWFVEDRKDREGTIAKGDHTVTNGQNQTQIEAHSIEDDQDSQHDAKDSLGQTKTLVPQQSSCAVTTLGSKLRPDARVFITRRNT